MSRRVVWWHCFSGIAGDMALGSLFDAGADLGRVRDVVGGLGVPGWTLDAEPVVRGGLAATRVVVGTDPAAPPRDWAAIDALLADADLPARVRSRARATFSALAAAEGRAHCQPAAEVHFHEVGGLDAIVDIVGTAAALEDLAVDEVRASAVALGGGTTRSAHGPIPVPAPAVLELLAGAPCYGTDHAFELTTPTGAALLAALASGWGPMPALSIDAVGRGAGSRELDGLPNVVQVVVGHPVDDGSSGAPGGQPVTVVETNVDDVTGEALGDLIPALLAAGAHDAWLTPVLGKKGRPAHVVSALVGPEALGDVRRALVAGTGTLGVRASAATRWTAARRSIATSVDGQPVRVKVSAARAKAEHDDVTAAAATLGRPALDVAAEAEAHARRRLPVPPALVLLDLDGTLVDSAPGIVASMVHTFEHLGLPLDLDVARRTIGPPLDDALRHLGVPPAQVPEAVAVYRAWYREHGIFDATVFAGVPALLDALAAAPAAVGLATSKPEPSAAAVLDHFGLTGAFDVVTGATFDDTRATKAAVLAEALVRAGLPGGPDVVMVGDRDHDVLGALAHGCTPVGVAWGYGSEAELLGAGAATVVADPAALARLLTS